MSDTTTSATAANDANGTNPAAELAEPQERDWRVWLGLVLTVLWLAAGCFYVSTTIGITNLGRLSPETLGGFLDGAFAPLAFLWLVIGYFLQQKELAENSRSLRFQAREIRRSAEQAEIQSRAIAASEIHARQQTFLNVAGQVRSQLGTIMGALVVSSQGSRNANGTISNEEQSRLFAQLSQGDSEVFSRRMIDLVFSAASDADSYALFYGTDVRARHSNNFINTFERLLQRARDCDPDGLIPDALRASGHGICYSMAKRYQALAPPERANPRTTGTYLDIRRT